MRAPIACVNTLLGNVCLGECLLCGLRLRAWGITKMEETLRSWDTPHKLLSLQSYKLLSLRCQQAQVWIIRVQALGAVVLASTCVFAQVYWHPSLNPGSRQVIGARIVN